MRKFIMSEYPILCAKCLGEEENLRMIRLPDGEQCKVCTRPFTVYRWQMNDGSKRSKKTLICKTCAKFKNCCQSCMLDVDFLIPLEIRDTALRMSGLGHLVKEWSSSRNSEVKAIIADKLDTKDTIKDNTAAQEILKKIATNMQIEGSAVAPTKKAPKAAISKETTISSRALKVIKSLPFNGSITSSNDEITSFFIFGFPESLPQYVITDYFEKHGKLKSISIIHKAKCGFISYSSRKSAEKLAQEVVNNGISADLVVLNNTAPVRIVWSEVKQLDLSVTDYKKIALVVDKVMAQLAEKEQKRPKKKAIKGKETKYEASREDFEL